MRTPEYLKIYSDLRGEIESGSLPVGAALPTEKQLSERYSCTRPTVRKAISALADQGLINRCPGVGSTVRKPEEAEERPLVIGIDLTVGVSAGPHWGKLLQAIGDAVEARQGILRVLHPNELSRLAPGEIDGVIITHQRDLYETSEELLQLSRRGVPVLLINRFPAEPEIGYISVNYRQESFQLVRRLLKNGARKIGIYTHATSPVNQNRVAGWRQAYLEEKLAPPEELAFCRKALDPERGPAGLRQALKEGKMEVLYVGNDLLLPEVARMLTLCGDRPPCLLCSDEVEELGEGLDLRVSYLKMPLRKMGELAVQHLAERRHNPALAPLRMQLESVMVVNHCDYLI